MKKGVTMALQEKKEKRKVEKKVRTPLKGQWKRHAVVLAVLVLVGTSVYLNWRYADNVAETGKILGQATLVNQNGEGVTQTGENEEVLSVSGSYFDTARLSRQQARDSALTLLQDAAAEEGSDPAVKDETTQAIQTMADYTVTEAQIENLVLAKGYTDCVAFIGDGSLSLVVAAPEQGLTQADTARIIDVVNQVAEFSADQIKIIEVE